MGFNHLQCLLFHLLEMRQSIFKYGGHDAVFNPLLASSNMALEVTKRG